MQYNDTMNLLVTIKYKYLTKMNIIDKIACGYRTLTTTTVKIPHPI